MAAKTQLWADVDPGHDDSLALILAGHNPNLELLGVSTVAGNQTVEKVTDNALRVLAAAGLSHIDVVAGAARPLMRPAPLLCPEIHGETGLDGPLGGPVLPPAPHTALPGKAPIVMFERISAAHRRMASDGRSNARVRLVATAALTNVALLIALYPEVVDMIEVVIMGGCLGVGNTGAVVEFNIQTDPEAARIVFESGVRLTMVPLEVTHTALVTTNVLQVEKLRVDIETASSLSAGQTVVDIWHQSNREKNCNVCMTMDVPKFWDLLVEAIHAADLQSPLNGSLETPGQ